MDRLAARRAGRRFPNTEGVQTIIVYLNGDYLPVAEARVSVNDRGFLFADAVYEAIPAYKGRCFLRERHLARLAGGLGTIRIEANVAPLADVGDELMARNDLLETEFAVFYMQVTRGAAPRTHAFPREAVPPTVFAFAKALVRTTPERWERGFGAITLPDQRWARADIKTTGLLPNVLAQQAAVEAEVEDAIFIRDGMVQEGTHNNVFAVLRGELTTAPATNHILHGVTRAFTLELCAGLGIPARERAFTADELRDADEIFFTGTTTEIRPTVQLDGRPVGSGRPGEVTRALSEAYRRAVAPVAPEGSARA
ncbi:aminotransferase class IV [Candidatus Palauibacter sp.]|uniref:aminotransferase class IV n=1 Tax=Candidatus Palauibacter sp. TaxID=3101350 RepID=UPI003B52135E